MSTDLELTADGPREDVDYFSEERLLARRLLALPVVYVNGVDRATCEAMVKADCYDIDVAEEVCGLYERIERELLLNGKGGLLRA